MSDRLSNTDSVIIAVMFQKLRLDVPRLGILFAFLLTVIVARLISSVSPRLGWTIGGVHVHHYVYGIFMLTAAGYLALIFKGPRASSWIALLYGCGVGLTFDEFGFWINPVFQRGVRWSYRGITTVVVALVVVSLIPILRRQSTVETDSAKNVGGISDVLISENPE